MDPKLIWRSPKRYAFFGVLEARRDPPFFMAMLSNVGAQLRSIYRDHGGVS